MQTKEVKAKIVQEYQVHPKDTGSVEVGVALLTERITTLTGHLKAHHTDNHSRTGLLKLVGHRRRLLNYLSREDVDRYRILIAKLGLRR